MLRARLGPDAKADLVEIKDFIASGNRQRALTFVRELRAACDRIARNPLMGRARDELRPGLRSLVYGQYVIIYRHQGSVVEIVRIVHGRRDIARLL